MKNATAISPEAMKAAGRVNSPRLIKMPVINSIKPEIQTSEPVSAMVAAGVLASGNHQQHFGIPSEERLR